MFSPSGRFGASGPKVAILWFALVALAALSLLVPASLAAGPTGAPGNNGTVKVHDGGAEPSPEVRNQPHVCTFHLHFFFADAAQSGSWQIRSWSPTGDGSVVLAGTYTTDANGEYRTPPAPDAYTLPNGHYKVFWEGRNSQNIKHKVFWVDCPAGAAQGSGSQETAAKANAHAGASFGAALKAEIAAELSTLEAMAGTDTSLRAEIDRGVPVRRGRRSASERLDAAACRAAACSAAEDCQRPRASPCPRPPTPCRSPWR